MSDCESSYSFEDLCLPLRDELVVFARKLTHGDRQRAEDVVQEALLKAFQGWHNFAPDIHSPGSDPSFVARGYLFRNVANTFVKEWHRKRIRTKAQQQRAVDILVATYGDRSTHEQALNLGFKPTVFTADGTRSASIGRGGTGLRETPVDSAFGDEVVQALAQLSADHREVIELYYVEQIGCDEMAEVLGIPKNTVFTRLDRARRSLARALGPYARAEYGLGRRESHESVETTEAVQPQPDTIDRIVRQRDRKTLGLAEQSPDQSAAG